MAKNIFARTAAGLSALAVATAALTLPTVASAQDQGWRGRGGDGRGGDGRGAQVYQNRGERGGQMRQWQAQAQAQAQSQAQASSPQQAPSAPAARQQGWEGGRNAGQRYDGRQASRAPRNGPDTRGWTPQQWEAYRGAVLEGRDTDAFRNGAGRPSTWQTDRQDRATDRRDGARWQDRRNDGRGGDRNGWQNDRRGDYGREAWRNNGRNDGGWSGDRGNSRGWDRGWRSNNRYDWSSYRSRNRNVFQTGRYYSPYQNYSYRRLGIGFSLGSLFYGQNYWINNPYQYRLPDVYGPYRWVRYYDDVLLVDIYSGEVVDAIYDFFW